jgi:hypothetical protein
VFCERDPAPPGAAHPDAGDVDVDVGDVDLVLRDPVFARPAGDPCYPPVLGHSNYFADPAFTAIADAFREGGWAAAPSDRGCGRTPAGPR